ncbi:MAG TPA: hypothetical protein DCZ12_17220 [Gammaproteobacteria bacterium]|nr:hypothetical protein [Gammaproteobacteria bacterium]
MFDLVSGLTNFVSDIAGGNDIIADAVNGALFGAVTTALGGGDILEGAAWGAAGNALAGTGDDGIFGSLTGEIGGGIAGYGIDKAMGGSGLLGAAGGALLKSMDDKFTEGKSAPDTTQSDAPPKSMDDLLHTGVSPEPEQGLLERLGLQTVGGDGTLLGKTLVGAAGAYGQSMEAEKQQERTAELLEKRDENQKELDERFKQRNIAAFSGGSPLVIRNG